MWIYRQSDGSLTHNGALIGTGYSGNGDGKNNPAMQDVPFVGPAPEGGYTIGAAYSHPKLGPVTMNLEPDDENEMFGRNEFRIHGDNDAHDASDGCLVQDHDVRLRVSQSADRRLQVIA